MEFMHCNVCGHFPAHQDKRNYYITSCGHVMCQNCAKRCNEVCFVCKQKCRITELNANVKPDIRAYFMDPMIAFRERLKQLNLVQNFQKAQQKSFIGFHGKVVDSCKRNIGENGQLKQGMEALRFENRELKQKIETMQQEQQSWIGSGGSPNTGCGPFTVQQPSTPRTSALFGNNGMVTPSRSDHRNIFNATPASASSNSNIIYGPGRLTTLRTPTPQDTPESNLGNSFFAAPGAGRPTSTNQTPDIVSRLRQLHCSASGTSTPARRPVSRSFLG